MTTQERGATQATQTAVGERWRDAVFAAIAEHLGIGAAALLGRCKYQEVAEARQLAMLLLHEHGNLMTIEVARLMARDHSTALHAYARTRARIAADPAFAEMVADMRTDVLRAYYGSHQRQTARRPAPRVQGAGPGEPDLDGLVRWDVRGLSAREEAEAAYWRRRTRERQRDMLGYAS